MWCEFKLLSMHHRLNLLRFGGVVLKSIEVRSDRSSSEMVRYHMRACVSYAIPYICTYLYLDYVFKKNEDELKKRVHDFKVEKEIKSRHCRWQCRDLFSFFNLAICHDIAALNKKIQIQKPCPKRRHGPPIQCS